MVEPFAFKQHALYFGRYAVVFFVLASILTFGAFSCSQETKAADRTSGDAKQKGTAAVASKEGGPTAGPSLKGGWVEVTLRSGDVYFGRAYRFDSSQMILTDVHYPSKAGDRRKDKVPLVPLGKEVHRPEKYMVIREDWVSSIQALTKDSSVREAIRKSGGEPVERPKKKEVLGADLSAIFLVDGQVYFARLEQAGEWSKLSDAHFMRRKDSKAKAYQEVKNLNELQLVSQATKSIGRDKDLWLKTDRIAFFEVLEEDSPVKKALRGASSTAANASP